MSLLFCFIACSGEGDSKLIKELQDKIASLENQIDELKNGNTTLNAAIAELQNKIANIEGKDPNSAEFKILKDKVAALEAANVSYKAQVADLRYTQSMSMTNCR